MRRISISNLERREIQASFFACLIRAYTNVLGYDKALEVASSAIKEDAMQTGRSMAGKYGGNTLSDLLHIIREVWAEEDALEFDILENTSQALNFNVTRCRYAELYDRLGLKEYGYCLSCNRDEALIPAFNPGMKLFRTQTIMQGANICDFRISMKLEKE